MISDDKTSKFLSFLSKKKLYIIILGLAIWIIVMSFVIVPLQGGLTSSTQLLPPSQESSSAYSLGLPIQEFMGLYGRSTSIAFVMLSHTLLANLHLGGSWIAVTTESIYLRNNKMRFKRVARSFTLFNVMLFSLGSTFAAAGIVFFIAYMPSFTANLFHIYWWPLFTEAILFAVEIIFLYSYWFSWDKIKPRYHQILGYGYIISVFFQVLMITMVASGMLTPGESSIVYSENGLITMDFNTIMSWWFNPTTIRLQIHRVFASISFCGFLLAMLAMFHFNDQKDLAAKKYWDWVGSYGIAWGLLGLILGPPFGMIYMIAISDAEPQAFTMIMQGPRAWEMLLMVSLLSALFLVVIVYFIDRRERILTSLENKRIRNLFNVFLVIAAVCALVLVQPAWLGSPYEDSAPIINFWGQMDYKYPALFTLVIIGSLVLMTDRIMLSDIKESDWGKVPNIARYAGILTGILGTFIVIVMGYVRESARQPYLIFNIIPVRGSETHPTPIPIDIIFIVWGLIIGIIITVFWFTSKVTAHHPEEAEELDPKPLKGVEEEYKDIQEETSDQ